MHALVVVAHPDPESLTQSIARRLAEGIRGTGERHSAEVADLAAEGFDPRFTAADRAAFHLQAPLPADVLAEQARIERADDLVLVYPIYWWSMPALLKGWIDRVFTNGWAYDQKPDGSADKRLQHLRVHLVALGGADLRTFARRGYFGAMRTQIDHGIFDYCGAPVLTSELLVDSETQDPEVHLATAEAIGRRLFETARTAEAA